MILIDDRVGSIDLADPLRRLNYAPVTVTRLTYADVAFIGRGIRGAPVHVGIELKRLEDLTSSLRSGRLPAHQNMGMSEVYDYRWLVVEGDYGVDRSGQMTVVGRFGKQRPTHAGMTLDEIEGRLLTLGIVTGLHLRHTAHRWQTLRFIGRLYRWWTDRDLDAHASHLVEQTHTSPIRLDAFRELLRRLPGVGIATSKAAKEAFGSPQAALSASVDEWAALKVKGKRLGRKAAETIVRFCREGE